MTKVYTAGKIWHAPKFQFLRDHFGFNVNARWIDYDSKHPIVQQKDILWQHCYEDVRDCDFVFLYSEEHSEEQRGALVEVGMAYGMNKPVYAAGSCQSTKPNAISDVAFTHFGMWTWLQEADIVNAFTEAVWLYEQQHKKAA